MLDFSLNLTLVQVELVHLDASERDHSQDRKVEPLLLGIEYDLYVFQ